MKIRKKVIGHLEKCYSIAPLRYQGRDYFLVAAEKKDRCLLFDLDGLKVDTVWTGPGGVMSMVQVPYSDGQFLATWQFYSPNDSAKAKIVAAGPGADRWEVRVLAELAHVHRIDIVQRGGARYLIACTLKSGHLYKDDWSSPGKVYAAVLPDNLKDFGEDRQLSMTVIRDGLTRNHGYCRIREEEGDSFLICADEGVFCFRPPASPGGKWESERLLGVPASDAAAVDLDGDGEKELVVISPFHGDHIRIYKKTGQGYQEAYEYGRPAEFSHAIYAGMLWGKPTAVIGHRKGGRDLIAFTRDAEHESYHSQILDSGAGAANVCKITRGGRDILIAANREIDEIAMYTVEEE